MCYFRTSFYDIAHFSHCIATRVNIHNDVRIHAHADAYTQVASIFAIYPGPPLFRASYPTSATEYITADSHKLHVISPPRLRTARSSRPTVVAYTNRIRFHRVSVDERFQHVKKFTDTFLVCVYTLLLLLFYTCVCVVYSYTYTCIHAHEMKLSECANEKEKEKKINHRGLVGVGSSIVSSSSTDFRTYSREKNASSL